MINIIIITENILKKKFKSIIGKYLIANSNFGDAYISGIPCKITSDPYIGKNPYLSKDKVEYIQVMSCITGHEYEIPYVPGWFKMYDTFEEVLTTPEAEKLLYRGYHLFNDSGSSSESKKQLIGKEYYPMDNSYSENFTDGGRFWVAGETVTILCKPYMDKTPYGDKKQFITVKREDGKIGKCLFMEWKLVP